MVTRSMRARRHPRSTGASALPADERRHGLREVQERDALLEQAGSQAFPVAWNATGGTRGVSGTAERAGVSEAE
jgi:hypothetical protein